MAKRSNSTSKIVALSALIGSISCSSEGDDSTNGGGTPTTGPTTVTATAAGPTTGGTLSTTGTSTTGSATVTASASASTTGNTIGGTTTGSVTTASASTTGDTTTGTATTAGAGGTSSTGSMSGAGGTATTGGELEDFDPTAEDFTCIADWQQVLRFRINNFLGHLDEAVAVANNPEGGVYPVGTILQHFPTEAMVKRRAGFSPETKDWEFFLLTLNQDGTTTIANRGTTDIMTMGSTCASCHAKADPQWDFVCNTYAEANNANPNCGFAPFQQSQLDQAINSDPRCD